MARVAGHGRTAVEIDGRELELSNLDKALYPTGFTKRDVLSYYTRIAPAILPHLRGRPITLKRYPEGSQGFFFYEKRSPRHRPPWVKTARLWSEGHRDYVDYTLVEDLATLVWVANLASLELHPSLSLAKRIERPTAVAFDLDPGAPAALPECCAVGLRLRAILDSLSLESFAKTSGSKGLQIYVPLNTRVSYDETKPFARALAELLEQREPGLVVSRMKKSLRVGKVLVDWSQNDAHKTTVCVWSLRARERPTVSTPVTWDEVKKTARDGKGERLVFEADEAVARFERKGDLFAPVEKLAQRLPRLH